MQRILKRVFSVFMASLMLFTAAPLSGFAHVDLKTRLKEEMHNRRSSSEVATYSSETVKDGLYYYKVNDDGGATITSFSPNWDEDYESVIIPSVIGEKNYPVTAIGGSAFWGCSPVKEVTVPSGVVTISSNAFRNCYSLEKINLPDTLKEIGGGAFAETAVKEIEIPDSVEYIGSAAFIDTDFYNDKSNWDNGIALYEDGCLIGVEADGLSSFSVKEGTRLIACDEIASFDLVSLHLPSTLEKSGSFGIMPNLKEITVSEGNKNFYSKDGILYESKGDTVVKYPAKRTANIFLVSGTPSPETYEEWETYVWAFMDGINVATLAFSDDFLNGIYESGMEIFKNEYPDYTDKEVQTEVYFNICCMLSNFVTNAFVVSKDNKYFCTDEYGVLYSKDKSVLIKYPVKSELAFYSLPETVDISKSNGEISPFMSTYGGLIGLFLVVILYDKIDVCEFETAIPENLIIHVPAKVLETMDDEEPEAAFFAGVDACTNEHTELIGTVSALFDEGRMEVDEMFTEAKEDFESGEITQEEYNKSVYIAGYLEKIYSTDISVCEGVHNSDTAIKEPSTANINYGETLILHTDLWGINVSNIEWTADDSAVSISPSDDGKTCAVESVKTGSAVITVKVTDENGNVFVDTQEINSKAGLWQKIVSFFKNLFGINRTIEQTIYFM